MMQNLLEPEFLSSHGSRVRKQVNAQTAVNTGMERNLYFPMLCACSDIKKLRPLWTPFLSCFLVINSLFRWGRGWQWDMGSHGRRRVAWHPALCTAGPQPPKPLCPRGKRAPSPGHRASPAGPGPTRHDPWCCEAQANTAWK